MINRYSNHWGRQLKLTCLPTTIIVNGSISLSPKATKVLAILYQTQKQQVLRHRREAFSNVEVYASAKIGTKKLIERTGYSKNLITKAVDELVRAGYLQRQRRRRKRQEFGVTDYVLLHPNTGKPMILKEGKGVLIANGVKFFQVPSCVLTASECEWSVANLSPSEWRAYLAILYLSNRQRCLRASIARGILRKLTNLSPATFKQAVSGLADKGVLWNVREREGGRKLEMEIADPYTGEPLHLPDGDDEANPANYFVSTGKKGVPKRLNMNCLTPDKAEGLIRKLFENRGPVIEQGNGDLKVSCCFHDDSDPSLSISPMKHCFQCFGCGETGTLTEVVCKVLNCDKATALVRIAAAGGQEPLFRQPDSKAIARYLYRDSYGTLQKEVLRFADAPDGSKVIQQRRPAPGGYIYDVSGLPPMLYNRDKLYGTSLVFICEGEKDAERITQLGLHDRYGLRAVAVTSGGADSWHPSFAAVLRQEHHGVCERKIILLPDNDEAGERYATQIAESLDAEGVEFQVASFAGTGCKDVSEYLQEHTSEDLLRLIKSQWVTLSDGTSPIPPELCERPGQELEFVAAITF